MSKAHNSICFTSPLWLYQGKGAWYFITVPKAQSEQIRFHNTLPRRGWGSVPVRVTIGDTTWNTSVFPDSKTGTFLLPVKAEVRRRQNLAEGTQVCVQLSVQT